MSGDPDAQNCVGIFLSFDMDTEKARKLGIFPGGCDWVAAKHWFELSANSGHWAALNNVAVMKLNGYGMERDITGAAALLERSANCLKRRPMERLAALLEAGDGIPQDLERAAFLRELAQTCDDS